MESGINKPLKVIWICHFTNEKIKKALRIKKNIHEFAPWISLGILEAEKRTDIELHIISPHRWIKRSKHFSDNNIHYYFFNPGIPFYGRHWPGFFRFDILSHYYQNRFKIKKLVKKIKPDIIHLHGTENAYFTVSFFDLEKNYPFLITIQGLITTIEHYHDGNKVFNNKIRVEKRILSKASNFGVRTEEMISVIKKYNKNANFFWHEYFIGNNTVNNSELVKKKYDIIYFASLTVVKGIEDLIKAIGLLKSNFAEIKVAVIGSASSEYLNKLKQLVIENNCENNITFLGHFIAQKDVHKVLLESKICVLPVYEDTIPGTIIESMFRKVPVVSYKTGGIPSINENDNNIEIVEKGDIDGLVNKISYLLRYDSYRKEIAEKAYKYANNRWNITKALDDIASIYHKIIENDIKE